MAFPKTNSVNSYKPARQNLWFLVLSVALVALFRRPIAELMLLGFRDDRYTPALAIPLLSLTMVWAERRRIFSQTSYSPAAGGALLCISLLGYGISASLLVGSPESVLALRVFALSVGLVGVFVSCYGMAAAKASAFPLGFVLLMIPVPSTLLEHVVTALQHGSAGVSYRIFRLTGVPVLRDGAVKFALPGVSIEVAEECSGIRSSMSLFISSLVAGYLLLRFGWSRVVFSAVTIPIVIFKNAVRIVTISLLGVYVDPGFLHGRLHRYGGMPFSILALGLLAPTLLSLMKLEGSPRTSRAEGESEPAINYKSFLTNRGF